MDECAEIVLNYHNVSKLKNKFVSFPSCLLRFVYSMQQALGPLSVIYTVCTPTKAVFGRGDDVSRKYLSSFLLFCGGGMQSFYPYPKYIWPTVFAS
jgi:hypothetical protein